jgi:uncharacterized protein (TIGR02996 family)
VLTPAGQLAIMSGMDTCAKLRRAICEDPRDDAPRLMYADWLDEHEAMIDAPCLCVYYASAPDNPFGQIGYVPAPDPNSGRHEGAWQNCTVCRGKGTIRRSNWYAARAKFIRDEIRAWRPYRDQSSPDNKLLATYGRFWLEEDWPALASNTIGSIAMNGGHFFSYKWSRGFINRIMVSPSFLVGSRCTTCTGQYGMCTSCDSTGRMEDGHAALIFSTHPITSVDFLGVLATPILFPDSAQARWGRECFSPHFSSTSPGIYLPTSDLPSRIFDLLPSADRVNESATYNTQKEAIDAASAAAVAYGRQKAGLTS